MIANSHTPRQIAARIAKNEQACPFPASAEVAGIYHNDPKVVHYGNLSPMLNELATIFFELYDQSPELINVARNKTDLKIRIASLFNQFALKTMYDDGFFDERINCLENTQKAREETSPYPELDLKTSIFDGILSYITAAELLYEALRTAPNLRSVAHREGNWTILNDVARLDLAQANAFTKHILITNPLTFKDLVEITGQGNDRYARFIGELPEIVYVPEPYKYSKTPELHPYDPLIPLSEITTNESPIGCPMSFNPKQVMSLWEIYATQRERIRRVDALSNATAFVKKPKQSLSPRSQKH